MSLQADLQDQPRFLLTDALHWEGGRVIRVWSYRWPVEIFHEFCKQAVGLEAAQVRKEEVAQRHFRLNCVAQSLPQLGAKNLVFYNPAKERIILQNHATDTVLKALKPSL